jgi:hypothetical protein
MGVPVKNVACLSLFITANGRKHLTLTKYINYYEITGQ